MMQLVQKHQPSSATTKDDNDATATSTSQPLMTILDTNVTLEQLDFLENAHVSCCCC